MKSLFLIFDCSNLWEVLYRRFVKDNKFAGRPKREREVACTHQRLLDARFAGNTTPDYVLETLNLFSDVMRGGAWAHE
jgi:hypothetical protein